MARALDVNGTAKVSIRRESKLKEVASKAVCMILLFYLSDFYQDGTLIPVACHVSSKGSSQAIASTIGKQTPFINLLVANFGYLGEAINMELRPAEKTVDELQKGLWNKPTYEGASQAVSTNIAASCSTFLAFMDLLRAGNTHLDNVGKSELFRVSSSAMSALVAWPIEAPSYVYNACKAALNYLTKTLSSKYAKHSIRDNAIAPNIFVRKMMEVYDRKYQGYLTFKQKLTSK